MVDDARTGQMLMTVVVRYSDFPDSTSEDRVDLISWHLDPEEADREAARLNAARAWEGVVYFVKVVRDRRGKGLPS
ncbi:hypothetical protein [Arthrobacter sp.]|uniref:hypothetical protein n=1 Tax=Arthrobacter sp. TaxID=1667 RepID=UPI002811058C|nr:hypothetical protein [Arthrobacter sp.]